MLTGKVAMVTGGAQGLGKSISNALARQGAAVVVADIDGTTAEHTAAELCAGGSQAIAARLDVTQPAVIASAVDQVLAKFRRLDILVNNAAIINRVPTIDLTEEQWDQVFDVNLKGALFCSQAAAKIMIPQGGGRIINIASTAAHSSAAETAPYTVSKTALIALTRVLAVEWARHNIMVNSVSPGTMGPATGQAGTAMKANPEAYERRTRRIPVRLPPSPDYIANAVVFFADEGSTYITGQDMLVDGGILCLDAGAVE